MYAVPTSLSPSRVESFTTCPLAFRFSSLDKLPDIPTVHTVKGSLVHRALELLFTEPPARRDRAAGGAALSRAIDELIHLHDFGLLALGDDAQAAFFADAGDLMDAYFAMENPSQVREIGLELRLEAAVGPLALRGVIDRLELDDADRLVVTDYKTGRSPGRGFEQRRLTGVHVYSFLCEAVLGRRPALIRLMYLRDGITIETAPSDQSTRFVTTRTGAVWNAVERACLTGEFRPRVSALCASCAYKTWCPAFGGDPSRAVDEAPTVLGTAVAA